jgi:hypothetical protein
LDSAQNLVAAAGIISITQETRHVSENAYKVIVQLGLSPSSRAKLWFGPKLNNQFHLVPGIALFLFLSFFLSLILGCLLKL